MEQLASGAQNTAQNNPTPNPIAEAPMKDAQLSQISSQLVDVTKVLGALVEANNKPAPTIELDQDERSKQMALDIAGAVVEEGARHRAEHERRRDVPHELPAPKSQ